MSKSKKILIAIFSSFVVIACIFTALFFTFKNNAAIKLIGEKEVTVELGSEYIDKGCKSLLKSKKISVEGNVNTDIPGIYKITYTTDFLSKTIKKERTVKVVDNIAPVICAPEIIDLISGTSVKNAVFEYSVTDNYDGDITNRASFTISDDILTLNSVDSSGNKASKNIKINWTADNIAPDLTLKGSTNIFLNLGEEYTEYGFYANDNIDGDLTYKIKVSGNESLNTAGHHTITYTVNDSSGNKTVKRRNIFVYDKNSLGYIPDGTNKVIYLTFDDGPCIYTPEVLKILDNYGIKATFFVTNQKPEWQHCISDAFKAGHSIAAHTYTHKYSDVYSSVENYFKDLDAINEVIKNQTGSYTKLIRFPGGSSNTISKNYTKGIMSTLTKKVTELGYVYFDWNVVSGDASSTSKRNDPNYIYNNVVNTLSSKASVVLMHDINKANLTALPKIIEYGLSNGYYFMPLDENSPTAHHGVLN